MSVISLPANLYGARMTWGQQRNDIEFRSMFGAQAVEVSPPLWLISLEADTIPDSIAGSWKAFLMQTAGRTNQVAVYDFMRPAPQGTLRGTLTLKTALNAGDKILTLNGGAQAANCTLLAGDLIGFGSGLTQQVVMLTADAQVDPETRSLSLDFVGQSYAMGYPGDLTISFEPAARNAIAAGSALVWDKPTVLCRRTDSKTSWDYGSMFVQGLRIDLLEDVRP